MITESAPILAILALTGWCTVEEAEKIQSEIFGTVIPTSVQSCVDQFVGLRDKVRNGG
jgi:hypothetical protein